MRERQGGERWPRVLKQVETVLNRGLNMGSIFLMLLGLTLLVAWPVAAIAQTALPVTTPVSARDLPLLSQVDVDSTVQTVDATLGDQTGAILPGDDTPVNAITDPVTDPVDPGAVVDTARQTVDNTADNPEGNLPPSPIEPPQLPGTGPGSGSDPGDDTIIVNPNNGGPTPGPIDFSNLIIDPITGAIISPAALAVAQGLPQLNSAVTELTRLGVSPNGDFQVSPAGASDASDSFSPKTGLALLPLLGLVCAFMGVAAYLGSAQKVRHAQA